MFKAVLTSAFPGCSHAIDHYWECHLTYLKFMYSCAPIQLSYGSAQYSEDITDFAYYNSYYELAIC